MSERARLRDWFFRFRHRLTGNGNWLQGHEPGAMPPEKVDSARIKVLIARLSAYSEVSRGITQAFLYQLASAVPDCYVDMAFFPNENDEKIFQQQKIPLWLGTTSKIPASGFDLIAVSNSVLQEIVNLPAALEFSGIPLNRAGREAKRSPLVIIGGANSYNHSILHDPDGAGLVDGVLIGDGELAFGQIIEIVKQSKNVARAVVLARLRDEVAGFYEPAGYRQVFAADRSLISIEAHEGCPMPVKARKDSAVARSANFCGGPVLYDEDAAGASHLLMTAGCPSFCSFCKESWEQKPYRERSAQELTNCAMQLKANMGLSEIALMSFNATTCSGIAELIRELNQVFARVSIKSQRFDTVANAPELLEMQFESGKRSYTCAMEGISARIRTLLQKNLTEECVLAGLQQLIRLNLRQLKVFMIVSGYETAEDMNEFKSMLEKIKKLFADRNARASVTFSFACLFRPPHTPLQFAGPRAGFGEMENLLRQLESLVVASGFEARISSGPADAFLSELVAYADRRFNKILVEASIDKGFRYRGEISNALYRFFRDRADQLKLPVLAEQSRNEKTVFPWDDIDTGVKRSFLWQNYQRLLDGSEFTACIRPPWGSGSCNGCGACFDASEINRVTNSGPLQNPGIGLLPAVRPVVRQVYFRVPELWAWCGPNFIKAAVGRRLMLDNPGLVHDFVRVSRIFPEFFAAGSYVAEIEFRNAPALIEETVTATEVDIKIAGFARKQKRLPDDFWPLPVEFAAPSSPAEFARIVDQMLTKYRLKHLKKRSGDFLNWEINRGQAKKSGIGFIALRETDGLVRLQLVGQPELHLLRQLAGNSPLVSKLPPA
ncbi:MAG: radical SAM protein [Candidatus Riflebacteria bacterium]